MLDYLAAWLSGYFSLGCRSLAGGLSLSMVDMRPLRG